MRKLMMCVIVVALAIPVVADNAFSYGTAYASNGACFNLRASYKLYERPEIDVFGITIDDFSVHADALFAPQTDQWGGGISCRAKNTGIDVVDNILDIAHVDGVGFAGILRKTHNISFDDIDWCLYAVTDIQF